MPSKAATSAIQRLPDATAAIANARPGRHQRTTDATINLVLFVTTGTVVVATRPDRMHRSAPRRADVVCACPDLGFLSAGVACGFADGRALIGDWAESAPWHRS